jgi:6-phosphogluconolactonase
MAAVQIFANADALLDVAADVVMSEATVRIAARGRFMVALSGGSTPQGLYRRLASEHARHRIDWARVHLFWGDERCVPPTDDASNYRMAREALIDHVPIPPAQVHRIHGEDPPNQAAARYDAQLRTTLGATGGGAGVLDLVLLGLGSDGHTASLFPYMPAPRETTRWVLAEQVDDARGWRITLTPPVLNAARAIVFLVAGADKADVLAAVLEGPAVPETLPAQRIAKGSGNVRWMVDRAAARLLTPADGA